MIIWNGENFHTMSDYNIKHQKLGIKVHILCWYCKKCIDICACTLYNVYEHWAFCCCWRKYENQ